MRINPLGDGDFKSTKVEEKKKAKKKGFHHKKIVDDVGFFEVLDDVELEALERRLAELVDEIIEAGNDLARSPTRRNLEKYKKKIKEFLKLVEKKLYKLSGRMDLESKKPKLHVVAEEVDKRIAEIAEAVFKAERPTLNIAARVGEINGLILDLLR